MRQSFNRIFLICVMCIGSAVLAGCPMPSTWTSPRTIPAGTSSHTIGVEWFGVMAKDPVDVNDDGDTTDFCEGESCLLPMAFPAYLFRIGVSDSFDLGIKGSTAGVVAADFKFQLVRSAAFDLAIDPTIQLSLVNYVTVPILFGLNASERFQIFLGPSATYVFIATGDSATTADGFVVGGTLGFRIGLSDSFAMIPEIHLLRGMEAEGGFLVTGGLGFNIGAGQPDYRQAVAQSAPMTQP